MVDSGLHGCVAHFLGKPFGDDVWQAEILQRVVNDLDRVVPQMPAEWSDYFAEARGLSHALLEVVGRHR